MMSPEYPSEYICGDCPRNCKKARGGARPFGVCRVPALPVIARAAPHFGEEPCINGTHGSGTVFFSGCNMRCVFCQNYEISRGKAGKPVPISRLREIFIELQNLGVHNINLVTPSHYTRAISEALSGMALEIPVAYNSSGYDGIEALKGLNGKVQIYMPDFKYALPSLAARYSGTPRYTETAKAAIIEMYRQTGPFKLDEAGLMLSGLIIRHLVLPGNLQNTFAVIDWVVSQFPPDGVMFSLMSQYTPMADANRFPEINRTLTQEEYDAALRYLIDSPIVRGFYQEPGSATKELVPDFDGTGV